MGGANIPVADEVPARGALAVEGVLARRALAAALRADGGRAEDAHMTAALIGRRVEDVHIAALSEGKSKMHTSAFQNRILTFEYVAKVSLKPVVFSPKIC